MRHELHPKRIGAAGTWKLFQRLLQRPTTGIGQQLRRVGLEPLKDPGRLGIKVPCPRRHNPLIRMLLLEQPCVADR